MAGSSETKRSVIEGIATVLSIQNHNHPRYYNTYKESDLQFGEARYRRFTEKTQLIIEELIRAPHSTASSLGRKFALSTSELAAIYKVIQVSDSIQQEFMCSDNGDYIGVAKNHFDTRAFEVVFFVGLSCPLRCAFCPSVSLHSNGRKTLRQYPHSPNAAISREEIARVFSDIVTMRQSGIQVLVKLSGGLEPFTNTEQMEWILELAGRHATPTQIFTNGVLLNTPKKRALALAADGVRISVSAPNQAIFRDLCLGGEDSAKLSFELLVDNLRNLIRERCQSAGNTVIGINSVIGAFNWRWFEKIIDLAVDIGVDYIDVKPDYYSADRGWLKKADEKISEIRSSLSNGKKKQTRIVFAGSINRKNVFNDRITGTTSVASQCNHKIFITPFGECTPVHYGALPQKVSADNLENHIYRLGKVTTTHGITDLLTNASTLPEIPFDLLNPFERILALESKRREEDERFGLPLEYSPYDTSNKNKPFALPLTEVIRDGGDQRGEFHDLRT